MFVGLIYLSFKLRGEIEKPLHSGESKHEALSNKHKSIVLYSGIAALAFVPIFKTITHLPPYMGVLFGLAVLWIITELLHSKKEAEHRHVLSVVHALRKIDTASILFFLGILISIAALQSVGLLSHAATWLASNLPNESVIVIAIGLLSSVVDNVPLVAAAQGMYTLAQYPTDHFFWEFLAYCAGTGGSILIIGSAAGVAAMGMEKIHFNWYFKNTTFLALIGYFAGAAMYILQHFIFTY